MSRVLALQMAEDSGARPDPYVLNSRANALGSLGRWEGTFAHYSAMSPVHAVNGCHHHARSQTSGLPTH